MKLIIHTDGASRGNPGPSAYGFTITDDKGRLLYVAEYTAVVRALEYTKERFRRNRPVNIKLYADSRLVSEQLAGRYRVKSLHLKGLVETIRILSMELGGVVFDHIPRSQNARADYLANKAIDKRQ